MDRKAEIKKDLWQILQKIYKLNEAKGVTDKQNEFLDGVVEYLDTNLSLRRKVVKEKPVETKKDDFGYINPDKFKFDL